MDLPFEFFSPWAIFFCYYLIEVVGHVESLADEAELGGQSIQLRMLKQIFGSEDVLGPPDQQRGVGTDEIDKFGVDVRLGRRLQHHRLDGSAST